MKNYLKAFLAVGAFLFASVGLAADTTESPIINSEDFEGLTADTTLTIDDTDWSYSGDTSEEGFATVKAYSDKEVPVDPPKKDDTSIGGNNYLYLETSAALYFNVPNKDDGTAQDIGSGLYFEGDVQFSPYEDDVDTSTVKDDGTKLLVYIKGDEAEATTNFVVVAGYYNGLNKVTTTNYVCKVPSGFDCNKDVWHHLLLKSYLTSDGNYSYFKVFVDGTALINSEAKGADNSVMANIGDDAFPSIDAASTPTTLEGIGFKGTGAIDNVLWTTVDPKPTEIKVVYVWSNGKFELTVNGESQTVVSGGTNTFYETDIRNATFTPNTGYSFDEDTDLVESITTEEGVTTYTYTYTPQKAGAVVTIEGEDTYVKDFVAAVTLVNEQTGDVTLKLLTDATVVSTDSIIDPEDNTAIYIGAEGNTVTLILNEKTLSIAGLNLYANGKLIIADKSLNEVSDTGCIITKKDGEGAGTIYAPTMTVYGGKFDARPSTDDETTTPVAVPDGYELPADPDSEGWYRLKKSGSSTDEPTIDGGDSGATTVDPATKTITVDSSATGEITITGDASAYTISVPQNVTTITGTVNKDNITIMGKSEGMTTAVNITGAFSVTPTDNGITIALNKDGSVTFTNSDSKEVTVKVTPELDTTEGTEPFAVGDSVVSATVKAIPGLTYQLLGSDTVKAPGDFDTANPVAEETAGAEGTVTLIDKSEKGDAKFYTIRVTR